MSGKGNIDRKNCLERIWIFFTTFWFLDKGLGSSLDMHLASVNVKREKGNRERERHTQEKKKRRKKEKKKERKKDNIE